MTNNAFIDGTYVPSLLTISSHIEFTKDLWYNGFIIGVVKGIHKLKIELNSFSKMHCSIDDKDAIFDVLNESELHEKLQAFDFWTLNKGIK